MNHDKPIQLSKNPAKLAVGVAISLLLLWILGHLLTTALIFSLAILIAYLILPAVRWLSKKTIPGTRRKIPWGGATLLVYLALASLLVFLLVILTPLVVSQITLLSTSMPLYLKKGEEQLGAIAGWYRHLHVPSFIEENAKKYSQTLLEKAGPLFSSLAANLAGGILKIFSALLIVITALVLSLYIVLDEKNIKESFYDLFPVSWRKDTEQLFRDMGQVVGQFLRGEMIMALCVALGSYALLALVCLFGIRYDYNLITALATGILYPIPYIGFWIPRLAAPLLAYILGGGWDAFWVFTVLTLWGVISDNLILPMVLGKGIGISPLMILIVVFAGGELFGIWGLLLAIPAAAVLRLLFFYLKKHVAL